MFYWMANIFTQNPLAKRINIIFSEYRDNKGFSNFSFRRVSEGTLRLRMDVQQ